jgi:hypothetical protein
MAHCNAILSTSYRIFRMAASGAALFVSPELSQQEMPVSLAASRDLFAND